MKPEFTKPRPVAANSQTGPPGRNQVVSERIRLVHLVTRMTFAGVGHVVASLLQNMRKDRYESSVWCIEGADLLGEKLRDEGFPILEVGRRSRRDLLLFFRLANLLRKNRITILHCHDELSWFYGAIAARMAGVESVFMTMHGRRKDISRRHIVEQKMLSRLTTTLVTVSSYLEKQIMHELSVDASKVRTIRNGIGSFSDDNGASNRETARSLLNSPPDAILIGSVGRLRSVKNFNLLLQATAAARNYVPSLRLILIGDGPERDHLIQQADALGLKETVTFLGERQDVTGLLPALDVYVCSSDYEGISLSILEAMAAGRPVIATSVGGNTEIIRDKKNGLLVEPGQCEAMVEAIIELATDESKRDRFGSAGQHTVVSHFGIDSMLSSYDRLYQFSSD